MPFARCTVQPEPAGIRWEGGVVVPASQSHAGAGGQGPHCGSAVPTTCPAALIALAWLNAIASTVPRSVGVAAASRQSAPWTAPVVPTVDQPTTWPATLIARASAPVLPVSGASAVATPFCQPKAGR